MRVYPDKRVGEEFKDLGDAGHTGTLNDRQFKFLRAQGLTGALGDMFKQWTGAPATPANAVVNRDGAYVVNRDGAYLIADPAERTS